MTRKHRKLVLAVTILLVAASGFFAFALIGYGYIAACLLLAAVLLNLFCYARRGLRIVLGVLLATGLLLVAVLEVPIVRAARTDAPSGCGYIVVLGAGVNGDTPSLSLVNRLDAAYGYLTANPETVAVVTGGQGPGENLTEAAAMRAWLEAKGIASDRIVEEDKAVSTKENLAFSFDLIRARGGDLQNVAVVSSEYHLYRAKLLAAQLGVAVTGIAGETTLPVLRLNYFIREGAARVYYLIFGVT